MSFSGFRSGSILSERMQKRTMHRVESSQIHSIDFDPVAGVMRAAFHCSTCSKGGACKSDPNCPKCSGKGHSGIYTYEGVPAEHYAAVRDAKSKGESTGATFAKLIKKGGHKFIFTPHGADV